MSFLLLHRPSRTEVSCLWQVSSFQPLLIFETRLIRRCGKFCCVAQEVTNRRETSIDQVGQKCQVSSCHISSFQLLLFETVWYGGIQPSSLFPKSNGTTRMQQSFLPIHDPWDFVMLWRSTPCSITTATLSRAVATHDNGWCTKFFLYNRGEGAALWLSQPLYRAATENNREKHSTTITVGAT